MHGKVICTHIREYIPLLEYNVIHYLTKKRRETITPSISEPDIQIINDHHSCKISSFLEDFY